MREKLRAKNRIAFSSALFMPLVLDFRKDFTLLSHPSFLPSLPPQSLVSESLLLSPNPKKCFLGSASPRPGKKALAHVLQHVFRTGRGVVCTPCKLVHVQIVTSQTYRWTAHKVPAIFLLPKLYRISADRGAESSPGMSSRQNRRTAHAGLLDRGMPQPVWQLGRWRRSGRRRDPSQIRCRSPGTAQLVSRSCQTRAYSIAMTTIFTGQSRLDQTHDLFAREDKSCYALLRQSKSNPCFSSKCVPGSLSNLTRSILGYSGPA